MPNNKYVFPTWKQFQKWSLPSKITFYGFLIGIISIIFTVFTFNDDNHHTNVNKEYIINIATELSSTIDEVKELLPKNIAYEKCIKNSNHNEFDKKFEECILFIKQNSLEASIKIKKVIDKFYPLLSPEDYNKIEDLFRKIDYTIYEIQNNKYIQEKYLSNNCPNSIDIICGEKANSLKKDFFDKNIGCILSVEYYGSFMERMKSNDDIISTVIQSSITKQRVKCLIFPGSTTNISTYFHDMNNQLVKKYLHDTEQLKKEINAIISKS